MRSKLDEGTLLQNMFRLSQLWFTVPTKSTKSKPAAKSTKPAWTKLQRCQTTWQMVLWISENIRQMRSKLDEGVLLQNVLRLSKLWFSITTKSAIATIASITASSLACRQQSTWRPHGWV